MDTRSYEEKAARGSRDKTKVEAASPGLTGFPCVRYSLRRRNA